MSNVSLCYTMLKLKKNLVACFCGQATCSPLSSTDIKKLNEYFVFLSSVIANSGLVITGKSSSDWQIRGDLADSYFLNTTGIWYRTEFDRRMALATSAFKSIAVRNLHFQFNPERQIYI